MSTLRARRNFQPPDARAARPSRRDYDADNRPFVHEPLEEILPGQGMASGWVDIDDGGDSDVPAAFEPAGADFTGEYITVPVIPKRADEFTCSSCFLIHHMSRLASSNGRQLLCADCA